ncbi:MAG: hypothetical protein PVI72_11770 [Desulfobacterales bacterium]|jgi:hypothetical protein
MARTPAPPHDGRRADPPGYGQHRAGNRIDIGKIGGYARKDHHDQRRQRQSNAAHGLQDQGCRIACTGRHNPEMIGGQQPGGGLTQHGTRTTADDQHDRRPE